MKRITFKEVWEQLALYGAPLWCGLFAAIIVFIIEIKLCNKKIIFAGFEKKIQKAREKGHIVKGKLIRIRYRDREPNNKTINRLYIANYRYTTNGIEGKYHILSTGIKPPHTIDLYYINNPKKVFSKFDDKPSPLQLLLYIVPLGVALIVMKLMGYK